MKVLYSILKLTNNCIPWSATWEGGCAPSGLLYAAPQRASWSTAAQLTPPIMLSISHISEWYRILWNKYRIIPLGFTYLKFVVSSIGNILVFFLDGFIHFDDKPVPQLGPVRARLLSNQLEFWLLLYKSLPLLQFSLGSGHSSLDRSIVGLLLSFDSSRELINFFVVVRLPQLENVIFRRQGLELLFRYVAIWWCFWTNSGRTLNWVNFENLL